MSDDGLMVTLLICSCGWEVTHPDAIGAHAAIRRAVPEAVKHWREGHRVTANDAFRKTFERAAKLHAFGESIRRIG